MTEYTIQPMTIQDYDEVNALWKVTEGIGLSQADSRENIARYLARNPGLSFVARSGADLVGAVICGDDGRRGYLHHLAVRASFRRRGAGLALVRACLAGLKERGITKCHIFVYAGNTEGREFWEQVGYRLRSDLVIMSCDL